VRMKPAPVPCFERATDSGPYSAWIFCDGAYRALRARTLDMMVLVAVAIGAGWLYSVGITLTGGGDVFYEAASVLASFVLLGHWFEMRARGGANDAIRALLDLAPPKATVIRDGIEREVPTAEVQVVDLPPTRLGAKSPHAGEVPRGESLLEAAAFADERTDTKLLVDADDNIFVLARMFGNIDLGGGELSSEGVEDLGAHAGEDLHLLVRAQRPRSVGLVLRERTLGTVRRSHCGTPRRGPCREEEQRECGGSFRNDPK